MSELKRKLKKEGAVQLYEKIVQLKMTDAAAWSPGWPEKRWKRKRENQLSPHFRKNA